MFGLCLFISATIAGESASKVYKFGVVPQFDARRISQIWHPILDQLEKDSGLKLVLVGSNSIPTFEEEFKNGVFDFVYMNPYHIITANKQQGYIPLVRDIGRELYGIVVVHKDSEIKKVEDLHGKSVAFPAPNALGASLMPRSELKNIYNIQIHPKYVQTHTSVYLNVTLGETAAGGGVQKTLEQQPQEIQQSLRILYKTERVPPHPVSVHPRVHNDVAQRIKKAFLSLGLTESGKSLLKKVPIQQIGSAHISDYDPIVKLGLEPLFQN